MNLVSARWSALALLLLLPVVEAAQVDDPKSRAPIPVDRVDTERVRLVLVDVIVLDKEGHPVPGLAKGDFEVIAAGKLVPIDTLDIACQEGSADSDAAEDAVRAAPEVASGPPESPRRIVLALDYQHLTPMQRVDVLEQAKDMIEAHERDDEEVLVAALTGGLRIEQPFTRDREKVLHTLHRMQYDITLWNGNFSHVNEISFVSGLTALLDVLGTYPGTKALVLFSSMADVPLELQFEEIAAVASASRCLIYPVDAAGLRVIVLPGMAGAGAG